MYRHHRAVTQQALRVLVLFVFTFIMLGACALGSSTAENWTSPNAVDGGRSSVIQTLIGHAFDCVGCSAASSGQMNTPQTQVSPVQNQQSPQSLASLGLEKLTATPEPRGMILLGSALLLGSIIARRKLLRNDRGQASHES